MVFYREVIPNIFHSRDVFLFKEHWNYFIFVEPTIKLPTNITHVQMDVFVTTITAIIGILNTLKISQLLYILVVVVTRSFEHE